ncbi:unnamed protein product [Prorocentrum cordatum]|uniref:Uncharacterized protein n=1 Tax=Prorocentrum cordatum TaxID=2364126 RepID=A0ABN9WBS2_9DINO|nr:unnamed protein product [Polarella glacialis]CAK0901742.1 unnamed protein product [Polarella glacialis]
MILDEALPTKPSNEYGFQIIKALVIELNSSQEALNSINEINKQIRLRDAGRCCREDPCGEEGRVGCEAVRLKGDGIAKQREAIVEGLKRSVTSGTSGQLSSDKVSELLLITQYFETLKPAAANGKSNSVVIGHGPAAGVADILFPDPQRHHAGLSWPDAHVGDDLLRYICIIPERHREIGASVVGGQ